MRLDGWDRIGEADRRQFGESPLGVLAAYCRLTPSHRHCASNVARPPSAVAMFRTMAHPLSIASFQIELEHWVVFHSEDLAALHSAVIEADAM